MVTAVIRLAALALLVGACGGPAGTAGTASALVVSSTAPGGEQVVIRLRLVIAPVERAEVVSSGEVLEGSTLGDGPFCVGGTTEDRHANEDPAMEPYGLLARTFTCPDGIVKMAFTPEVGHAESATQGGSWTFVSGTGVYEGLRGSGQMEVTYDPDPDAPTHEMLTGTATR